MQIVCGGKVSRLHDLLVIRRKTFAIVQQFETPCNRKAKSSLENFHDWRLIRKNRESFPPQRFSTVNDLHYTVYNLWLQDVYNTSY